MSQPDPSPTDFLRAQRLVTENPPATSLSLREIAESMLISGLTAFDLADEGVAVQDFTPALRRLRTGFDILESGRLPDPPAHLFLLDHVHAEISDPDSSPAVTEIVIFIAPTSNTRQRAAIRLSVSAALTLIEDLAHHINEVLDV